MTDMPTTSPDELWSEENYAKFRETLSRVLCSAEIVRELNAGEALPNSRMVYTQAATLVLLILQRLDGGLSLQELVKNLRKHHLDLLPENRRVTEGTLSSNPSAYHQARKRIPLETVEKFSTLVCNHFSLRAQPLLQGRRVFVIDGTTLTFAPTPELKKAFPPASNQLGPTVWPVALLLVAHELQTGCAMVPQIHPMYGPNNSSETQQAICALEQLPPESLVMADSNFGVYSVAWKCRQERHAFLFRLSKQRYKSHIQSATLIESAPGHRTYHLLWKPSPHEQKTHPWIPKEAVLEVFVHQIDVPDGKTVELITDLEIDALSVADLYQRRYEVEFDIRDLKVTMNTENIRAKSVDIVLKELWGSILAYNLVVQFRRQAAQLQRINPRELSFTGVWLTFRYDLLQAKVESLADGQLIYTRALINAGQCRLPKRTKQRSYPRVAHPRRKKSTKTQKERAKEKAKQKKELPPDPPL